MQKNLVVACGLGDLFIFLSKLDDFFAKNPEYTSIKFWAWNHSPELAKELISLSKHNVSVYSVEDMVDYLKKTIPEDHLKNAEQYFIRQNSGGVGVDKFVKFINQFFPNLEQWVWIGTYNKYKSAYPFHLEAPIPKRDRGYLVVHPVSHTVKTEKAERTWSMRRWGKLITMINKYCIDYDVILIGRRTDKIEGVRDITKSSLIDLRGKTTLTEAIGLVLGAKAVFGINSWPTHMAYWNNIPTYIQWFVQHQLLDTHTPKDYKKLKHVEFDFGREGHPTTAEAWSKARKVISAAAII